MTPGPSPYAPTTPFLAFFLFQLMFAIITPALVTGASRGLGYATAECLVADGARVIVSGRTPSTVDDAVDVLLPEKLRKMFPRVGKSRSVAKARPK